MIRGLNSESATHALSQGVARSAHRGNDRHFRSDRETDMTSAWTLGDTVIGTYVSVFLCPEKMWVPNQALLV